MSQFWLTHGDRMKIGRSNPCWVLGTLEMLREKWKQNTQRSSKITYSQVFLQLGNIIAMIFVKTSGIFFGFHFRKEFQDQHVLHESYMINAALWTWHRPPGSRSSSWSHVGGFMWFQLKNIETYLKNMSWSVWVNKIFSKCKGWNFLQQICVYNVNIIYYIL